MAHLPWRVFVYKALSTFIDDLFAFLIRMPTLHRLRVFRDDIIFLIYLYQRWIYPVDRRRVEVGADFADVSLDEIAAAKDEALRRQGGPSAEAASLLSEASREEVLSPSEMATISGPGNVLRQRRGKDVGEETQLHDEHTADSELPQKQGTKEK